MRAAFLTLLTTICLSSGLAHSRNGETGILIVIKRFQIQIDEHSHRSIVICEEDWLSISELIEDGVEAQIYLKDNGTYAVEESAEGQLFVHLLKDESSETFSLISSECPIETVDEGC